MPSYGLGRAGGAFDLKVPSGNTCRMKHADLEALIAAGVVDSLDELTSLVQTDHVDRVKKGKKTRHLQPKQPGTDSAISGLAPEARAALDIMKDPKRWTALQKVINAVVVQCVLEPKVLPELQDGQEYTVHEAAMLMTGTAMAVQDVSLMDRMAIFSEAMEPIMQGQAAMQPFRGESSTVVADLADVENVQPDAERNAGDQ